MALRLLHLADSHLGCDFPGRGRDARQRRAQQLVDSYSHAVALALEKSAHLVIHSGDLFDSPKPPGFARFAAATALTRVAATGVPVVVIAGNHEPGALGGDLLLTHPGIHVFTRAGIVKFSAGSDQVCVLAIPYHKTAAAFLTTLLDTLRQVGSCDRLILACHQTFRGAVCGAHLYRFTGGDDVIDTDALPAGLSYVAAGHVHRHQVLTNSSGCPIVYAGSTDRISFAEREEAKGCVLVEFEGSHARPRFLEHAVRPMRTLPVDLTGQSAAGLRRTLDEVILGLPRDALAELRISGQVPARVLRGLRLAVHARRLRPDVDLRVAMQAVRFVPERDLPAFTEGPSWSVFRLLDSAEDEPVGGRGVRRVPVGALSPLPQGFGTYAFYAADGRVLYIGKATDLRARVRSHLREGPHGNFFTGWAAQAAWVEARPAESELEAALIEAELVRRLRPPFNIQMRNWKESYYISAGAGEFAQLAVLRDPPPGVPSFGPWGHRSAALQAMDALNAYFGCAQCAEIKGVQFTRNGARFGSPGRRGSRPESLPLLGATAARLCERYFSGRCSGPCAGRVGEQEYRARVRMRDAFIAGQDDSMLREMEAQIQTIDARVSTPPRNQPSIETGDSISPKARETDRERRADRAAAASLEDWRHSIAALRAIFNRASQLRQAAQLLGRRLLLPGPPETAIVACFDPDGFRLERAAQHADANLFPGRVQASLLPETPGAACDRPDALPKSMLPVLLVAERALRNRSGSSTIE